MKKIFLISSILILCSTILILSIKKQENRRILYSWNLDSITKDFKKFQEITKNIGINTLYQDFTKEFLKAKDDTFLLEMQKKEIETYHLAGDPSWGEEDGFFKIKEEIDLVLAFNQSVENKIKGIVLDIEPYASEKVEEFELLAFEKYVKEIEKTYRYTKENQLELILAIPYWLDHISLELLENLIKNTDGISVMNYKKDKTMTNIKEEIEYAKKYQKKIDTIYEVEGTNKTTLKNIEDDYKKIQQKNKMKDLNISFHHYQSMK